jgi:protein TonB
LKHEIRRANGELQPTSILNFESRILLLMSLPPTTLSIVTTGPVRAAAEARELAWTLAGSVAFHASLLVVASIIPVNSAVWMMNAVPHNPPSGDNTIQLSVAFLDAAAASPAEQAEAAPAVVVQSSPVTTAGNGELVPRKMDVLPLGSLAAPLIAMANAETLQKAAPQSAAAQPEVTRQKMTPSQPKLAEALAKLPREVTSKLPAESTSTLSQATAAVSAPDASGAPDVLPSEVHSPFPAYPPELLARRIQATVVLRLKIAADGTVAEATVHKTSGYEAMDQAALAGVKSWKFKPAQKNGKQVETAVRKPFTFEIRE